VEEAPSAVSAARASTFVLMAGTSRARLAMTPRNTDGSQIAQHADRIEDDGFLEVARRRFAVKQKMPMCGKQSTTTGWTGSPAVNRCWRRRRRASCWTRRARLAALLLHASTFIPLSSIAFPHIGIFCLTAKRLAHFKKTVVFYPICMLAIWLPSVFLGVIANRALDVPAIKTKVEARAALTAEGASSTRSAAIAFRADAAGDDVVLALVQGYAPLWLTALLARP